MVAYCPLAILQKLTVLQGYQNLEYQSTIDNVSSSPRADLQGSQQSHYNGSNIHDGLQKLVLTRHGTSKSGKKKKVHSSLTIVAAAQ